MRRLSNIDSLINAFHSLDRLIHSEGAVNYQRTCKESEPFFRDLLNAVYGFKLRQVNVHGRNHPCFDLSDEINKVAVQVTADTSLAKTKRTLTKFRENYSKSFTRLIMVYPRLKKDRIKISPQQAETANLGNFDLQTDRLDLTDLLRTIQALPIEHQNMVIAQVTAELPNAALVTSIETKTNSPPSLAKKATLSELTASGNAIFSVPESPLICIVGSGFAGSVSAIRFLELVKRPVNILFIDGDPESNHGGLAYGPGKTGWEHLLNIQAGRISLYRERPSDFLDWVNDKGNPYSSGWIGEWSTHRFHASSSVPRRIYGDYIADRLNRAISRSQSYVSCIRLDGEVTKVVESSNKVQLMVSSRSHQAEIQCDYLVLATGHGPPIIPQGCSSVIDDARFFKSPYQEGFSKAVHALQPNQQVVIIGTGLSAYDAIMTLRQAQFAGPITMISRNGLTHKPYPLNHLHEIVPLPIPKQPPVGLSPKDMRAHLEMQIEHSSAILREMQPDIQNEVVRERVLKSLEPWVAVWIQQSTEKQVVEFLSDFQAEITTSRTGIVRQVESVVYEMRYTGAKNLEVIPGLVLRTERLDGYLGVTCLKANSSDNRPTLIHSDLVVCCLGMDASYESPTSPLWQNLISVGNACVHQKTGKGVRVNKYGCLVRMDGSVSDRFVAVGPMRQGDEIERHGRLGAFVFSIGTIRNQSLIAATYLLRRIDCPEYANANSFERRKLDAACSDILKVPSGGAAFRRLTNALLSVELCDITTHPGPNSESVIEGPRRWLQKHQDSVKVSDVSSIESADLVNRLVLHRAYEAAALIATNVTRLAPDYQRIQEHPTGSLPTDFINERLICSSLLRGAVDTFGAACGSLLVYSPDDKKLHPFSMHRRTEGFTKTSYGEAVNGLLVKAFCESLTLDDIPGLNFIYDTFNKICGCIVADYNDLPVDVRKTNYLKRERRYPSILAALLTEGRNVLGVVYIEAEKGQRYEREDVNLLANLISVRRDILKKAQSGWDRATKWYYRFGDFSYSDLADSNLRGQDLRYAVFKGATLSNANLEEATLSGCNFNDVEMNDAILNRTKVIAACFINASLQRCSLDGSKLKYCNFNGADFRESHLSGSFLTETSFIGANLSGVKIAEHDVSSLDFTDAVLENAVLFSLSGVSQAKWAGVNFQGAKIERQIWEQLPNVVTMRYKDSVTIL